MNKAYLNFLMITLLLTVSSCTEVPKNTAKLGSEPVVDDIQVNSDAGASTGTADSGSNTSAPAAANSSTDDVSTPSNTGISSPQQAIYTPAGVGAGGAMSGAAISPYASLRFVGTDMGSLFRSVDDGQSWQPVHHYQTIFDSRLHYAVSPGFSSDGVTIFHAVAGVDPQISHDRGITFQRILIGLKEDERIIYWKEDSKVPGTIYAGTTSGVFQTKDNGQSWDRIIESTASKGIFLDHAFSPAHIYHATQNGIQKSVNSGGSFSDYYTPSKGLKIRMFTGGRDANGLTLAFSDNNGTNACSWANQYKNSFGVESVDKTMIDCGYLWTNTNSSSFTKSQTFIGDHLKMAENDSQTMYHTGGRYWLKQYGTKVHVSKDAGKSWELVLHQYNWDITPYEPWPVNKMEYSAIALDVGWHDDGYESFAINNLNSSQISGTGYYFLFNSNNYGQNWKAPFTQFKDEGVPSSGKKWKTRGLEVISVYKIKAHPTNKKLLYAGAADISGMVSEDGGETWRITKAAYNSNYDYAFDPEDDNVVYAASGNLHDYPEEWHANAVVNVGGIYKSNDRGRTWKRIMSEAKDWQRQFLSVAYDHNNKVLYAGSHSKGIARSKDDGKTWEWINDGIGNSAQGDIRIIPQIEIDPVNGHVYTILAGDAPDYTNRELTGIYYLNTDNKTTKWSLLRKTIQWPQNVDKQYKLWYYPSAFAIDFSDSSRNTLWLIDNERGGQWLASGVWKSIDRGNTWKRKIQYTHTRSVMIDPQNSQNIFVSGMHQIEGTWGIGGNLHSTDGGETWFKNVTLPYQRNGRSVTIDPSNPKNMFYTFFGSGILKGPNPIYGNNVEVKEVTE